MKPDDQPACFAWPLLLLFVLCPPAPGDSGEGVVRCSNGEVIRGTVRLTPGKKLELFHKEGAKRFRFGLEEVARIDVVVESRKMERPWRFKEEGNPEKIYGEERYPLQTYLTFVTLKQGEVRSGRLVAVLYVRPEGGFEKKLLLLKKAKGVVGQDFADLVYPASIDLTGGACPAPEAVRLRLQGGDGSPVGKGGHVLSGDRPGALEALALDPERRLLYRSAVDPAYGAYRFEGLLPGRYRLIFRYPDRLVVGWPATSAAEARSPDVDHHDLDQPDLDENDQNAIARAVTETRDFYEKKQVRKIQALGENKAAALVDMVRVNPVTLPEEAGPFALRRFELFFLTRAASGRWMVASRLPFFTIRTDGTQEPPVMDVVFDPALAGIQRVSSEQRLPLQGNRTGNRETDR